MRIFFCTSLIFLSCSFVFAHTCATYKYLSDKEYRERLGELETIFYGEILEVDDLGTNSYLIKYKVLRVWKGDKVNEITIQYNDPCSQGASKSFENWIGEKHLVYAYPANNKQFLIVDCCRPFDDDRMKLEYGEGVAIEHPSQDIKQSPEQNIKEESFLAWLWKKVTSFFA